MKKILTALLLVLVLPTALSAQGKMRHQLRWGWGDMLFETMAFHPSPAHAYPGGYSFGDPSRTDYFYTGHIFAEYQYRLCKAVRVGFQADIEGIFWKEDGSPLRNYDLTLMPTVRFNYVEKEIWSLYSGLGAGLLTAFDSLRNVELAPAFNLNFIGVEVGKGHWYGGVDLGFMVALNGVNKIYMLGSRLISFSANYRW